MREEGIAAREVAGHADVLRRDRHLCAARHADGAAHLLRDRLGERFSALQDEGVDAVEQRGPALRGTHRPGREGAPGRGHGHRDVLRVAQRDFRDGFFGRRVDDGASGLPCGQDPLTADEDAIQTAGAEQGAR